MKSFSLNPFFSFFVGVLAIFIWPLPNVIGQSQWEKYAGNPVLSTDFQFGVSGFSDPTLLFDGEAIHLWLTGGGIIPGGAVVGTRTCYYTSTDGLSWQPCPTNPVFREGAAGLWDSGHIETPSVIRSSEGFRLYYSATPDSMPEEASLLKIGLATSPDGETWIRHPANPILERGLPGSWEERHIESPCVLKTDSLWYMWYSGVDIEWKIHVGLAISNDGKTWQKHAGNPVFSPTPGSEWDSVAVYAPQVRWLKDYFVMLYTGMVFSQTGYDFDNTRTGVALSKDGVHWTRADDQPVLWGTPGAWDAAGPYTLDWIVTNDFLLLVYARDGKVGIATAPLEVVRVDRESSKRPEVNILFQNYPNPFNPTTTIQYQLPNAEHVTIKIYDMKGQEVETLVQGYQTAGTHEILWNGKNYSGQQAANGVYLYKMKTDNFTHVRKMILLQ